MFTNKKARLEEEEDSYKYYTQSLVYQPNYQQVYYTPSHNIHSEYYQPPVLYSEEYPREYPREYPEKFNKFNILLKEINKLGTNNIQKIVPEYTERVMLSALADAIYNIGPTYKDLVMKIENIMKDKREIFTSLYHDKITHIKNFWIVRRIINIEKTEKYGNNTKREVLMSLQFYKYLREFCKIQYNDNIMVGLFCGDTDSEVTNRLIAHKIPKRELNFYKDVDIDDLLIIQFRKKNN